MQTKKFARRSSLAEIKIEKMENKYDQQFKIVFEAIKKLLEAPAVTPRKIGFNTLSKRSEQSRF